MFLKKIKKNSFFRLTTVPIFLLASFLSILFSAQISPSTYATSFMNLSIVESNINFHFNQAENAASAFKEDFVVVQYDTNNKTGFTAYVSSIDEDTSLSHTDSSVAQKITSITSPSNASSFNSKNWGYLADQASFNSTFKPIPKASQPEQVLNISTNEIAKFFLHFGVKTGSDLPAGTYSKKILVTAITNHVPTSTVFVPGQNFRDAIASLGPTSVKKSFKRANAAPPTGAATTVVSTADSEVPAYVWYDQATQSILWWSDADTAYANEDSSHMFEDIGDDYSDMDLIDVTGINTSRVKNMSLMFHSSKNLYKHIELGSFDTSNSEDMSGMFATDGVNTMENIDPIDFSSFDTRKVTNMENMFDGSFLPSIDIHNFNTSNVTEMSYMFASLGRPTTLNLSGLDVRSVRDFGQFFWESSDKITSLNLSGWDLSHLDNMTGFFAGMENLEYLNLQDFKTTSIVDMRYMFAGVKKLRNLDLSSFDTSQVIDMSSMFQDMESLTTIDLSSFDTSNVTNMKDMFYGAFMDPENSTLDLSSFDTRNVTDMRDMFSYSKLKTIYASPSFVTTAIRALPQYLFQLNSNLTGANGTTWDSSKRDHDYARIDTPGNPGFFTQKP